MDIRIYVQTHKSVYVPQHDLLVPLQIGAASHEPISGMVQDDTGDNISQKNANYCEMTGQYWVWKNVVLSADAPDYIGFFHYRRYLRFTDQKHPYEILGYPDEHTLAEMGYETTAMADMIARYDILVPEQENMYETAWQNYAWAPDHFSEDLLAVTRIVVEMDPGYGQAISDYLGGTCFYLKNMYIMKRELFDAYCSWLFPILEAFDSQNKWTKYKGCMAANRVDGYLAERLFGIWFTKQKLDAKQGKTQLKYKELPRVHFANMDGGKGSLKKMQLINIFLPSGTRRRSWFSRPARWALKWKANRKYR